MRPIDADKLKKHYAWWGDESASEEMKENKKIFDTIIGMQPTVEAEPIRHGKWIEERFHLTNPRCSLCGYYSPDGGKHNFCPNCGAKMDESAYKP